MLFAAGALMGGSVVGCGPSFQVVYEGNVRFEHCYALEENPRIAMPEKAACWREWSERYTYGQTRDRVHYATARYVALTQAPSLPTDEALMMAAPGETPRMTTITAPAPTNAFAPPPKTLDPGEARPAVLHPVEGVPLVSVVDDAGGPEPAPVALPAESCAATCGGSFRGCTNEKCASGKDEARGGKDGRCASCLKSYRICMRSCFK